VRGICVDRYAYGPWRCYDDGGRDVAGNFGHVLYAAKDGRACVLSSKSGRLVTEYAGSERTAPLGKRGERGRRRRLRRRRRRLSEGRWVDREDDDGRAGRVRGRRVQRVQRAQERGVPSCRAAEGRSKSDRHQVRQVGTSGQRCCVRDGSMTAGATASGVWFNKVDRGCGLGWTFGGR
jgi:hypothetical protein